MIFTRASHTSCASHVTSLRPSSTVPQRRGRLVLGTVHESGHGTGYPHGVQGSLGEGGGEGTQNGKGEIAKESTEHAGRRKLRKILITSFALCV